MIPCFKTFRSPSYLNQVVQAQQTLPTPTARCCH